MYFILTPYISIHEALANLDLSWGENSVNENISIHEALANLDLVDHTAGLPGIISIHEALANLDGSRKE